jgi:hypothetical protein
MKPAQTKWPMLVGRLSAASRESALVHRVEPNAIAWIEGKAQRIIDERPEE